MALTILQEIILGIIQGITEWLPISSSGMSALVMSNFFKITDVNTLLRTALWLHLGTFFAALIYFRKDVWILLKAVFNYKRAGQNSKNVLNFLLMATIISGIIGFIILKLLTSFESQLQITGKAIALFISIFLIFTGIIQIKIKNKGLKHFDGLQKNDGMILGFAQGLASLPGLSRSGMTVSALLLKNFDDTTALRLSFLMSLPIVLLGNILLNLNEFSLSSASFYGLLASFVFGILTIHGLMKFSKRINFGWFVLIFAVLMLISLLI